MTDLADDTRYGNWLPIESAPRDGTHILLWYSASGHEMAFWNGHSWDDGDFYDNLGSDSDFSHWMPLPAAPQVPA